jgi:hypothetical protein
MKNQKISLLKLRVAKLIEGDVFNVQFVPESNIDFSLDNIRFTDVKTRNNYNVRTPAISDSGIKIMKICIQTENPELVNSPCTKYQELYQDQSNLIIFKKKFKEFNSHTNVMDQEPEIVLKHLSKDCTLGTTYRTFFIRICDK